jgi:hypothetical protein
MGETMTSQTHTVPFHIYMHELAAHLIALGTYDLDWFQSQTARIAGWHDAGETLNGAKDMLAVFAAHRRRTTLTPRQMAEKFGRVVSA